MLCVRAFCPPSSSLSYWLVKRYSPKSAANSVLSNRLYKKLAVADIVMSTQIEMDIKVKCLEVASKHSTSQKQLLEIAKELFDWICPKVTPPISE